MQYHAPSKCPVCGGTMAVTKLHCNHCATELSGAFSPCRFCMLEAKHMEFIETFLRCRGSIKEVEKALGVSYPTVRNMMDAALTALDLNDKPAATDKAERAKEDVLSGLREGKLTVTEAVQALGRIKGENEDER